MARIKGRAGQLEVQSRDEEKRRHEADEHARQGGRPTDQARQDGDHEIEVTRLPRMLHAAVVTLKEGREKEEGIWKRGKGEGEYIRSQ